MLQLREATPVAQAAHQHLQHRIHDIPQRERLQPAACVEHGPQRSVDAQVLLRQPEVEATQGATGGLARMHSGRERRKLHVVEVLREPEGVEGGAGSGLQGFEQRPVVLIAVVAANGQLA
jgi:hypothetical protein